MQEDEDLKYFRIPILDIQVPISPSVYKDSALRYGLAVSAVGFILIQIFWGEITLTDVFGMLISFFLISYLIHLLRMF